MFAVRVLGDPIVISAADSTPVMVKVMSSIPSNILSSSTLTEPHSDREPGLIIIIIMVELTMSSAAVNQDNYN